MRRLFVLVLALGLSACGSPPMTVTTSERPPPTIPWAELGPATVETTTTTVQEPPPPPPAPIPPPEPPSPPRAIQAPDAGTWDAIAACESGQRWDDTRGGYEGGLHFMPDTWVRAGGRIYAEHAYEATRGQQIEIAQAWLERTSWAQWPTCSRNLGLR